MTAAIEQDDGARIEDAVRNAIAAGRTLWVCGQGSKAARFPGSVGGAERLSTLDHSGVLHYAPEELVIEARAGTPLRTIEALLAQHDQELAFEPPRFRAEGTLGGAVAAGLSGPARPWRGSVRDAVLGVTLINGLGERLRFGGRVVKNVAGYDLSRLQVGAFGTFGCLLSVALRVMPRPTLTQSLIQELAPPAAFKLLTTLPAQTLPLSGACYLDGRLWLRLAGAPESVQTAAQVLGGERVDGDGLWRLLRDYALPYFTEQTVRWRASLPPGTGALPGDAEALIDWGGAQRFYRATAAAEPAGTTVAALRQAVESAGGYLEPFDRPGWQLVNKAQALLQQSLRQAFDPHGLFAAEAD